MKTKTFIVSLLAIMLCACTDNLNEDSICLTMKTYYREFPAWPNQTDLKAWPFTTDIFVYPPNAIITTDTVDWYDSIEDIHGYRVIFNMPDKYIKRSMQDSIHKVFLDKGNYIVDIRYGGNHYFWRANLQRDTLVCDTSKHTRRNGFIN